MARDCPAPARMGGSKGQRHAHCVIPAVPGFATITSVLKSPARAIVDSGASTSMCGLETAQYWQETMAQAFGEDLCEIQNLPPVEF
eukprot:15473021-Alexandrium_andersonii.AAC.1